MKKDLAKTEFTYSKQKEKMEHKTNTKLWNCIVFFNSTIGSTELFKEKTMNDLK